MTAKIKLLSKNLINQIAAGEVIARPASVVKELLENSFDAHASLVTIYVSNNCRDIKVTDDGDGMSPEDAEICFKRHSTSKIASLDDLEKIDTRGFRGEALASISSIAKIELITRYKDDLVGTKVAAEGSEIKSIEQIGAPIGTTIFVRDIFYNTPARLKFLKSEKSEFNAIVRVLTQQLLSIPQIGISLFKDGRKIFELPKNQSYQDRIIQLIGSNLEGKLIPVQLDLSGAGVKITGFISKQDVSYASRVNEYFYVNLRPIRSQTLAAALSEGYKGSMMTQRYPFAVLFITISPDQVDVNVHPTKEEVRFKDEGKIFSLIHRSVVEGLRNIQSIPVVQTAVDVAPQIDMQNIDFQKSTILNSSYSPQIPSQILPSKKIRILDMALTKDMYSKAESLVPRESRQPPPMTQFTSIPTLQSIESAAQSIRQNIPEFDTQKSKVLEKLDFSIIPNPIGQIANTYILAEMGNDLLLIDQHAAHERLVYQRLIERQQTNQLSSQPLLVPITIEIPITQLPYIEYVIPIFAEIGIEIEEFGKQTFVIRTIPIGFDVNFTELITDTIESIELKGKPKDIQELKDAIITRLACHSAIRSGQKLHIDEMRQLIAQIIHSELSFTCPHGRPTMILITKEQLDKQFKR